MSRRNQAGDRFDEDEVVSRSITIDPQTGLENFVRPPLALIVRRAARWRCPNCGRGRLFARGFQMLQDRKSTRLNSSHGYISYAVFCLKKKYQEARLRPRLRLYRSRG